MGQKTSWGPAVLRALAAAATVAACSGEKGMSDSAVATVPSPMWLGVEQVVIACDLDAAIQPQPLRDSLCRQITEEAARLTSYPVRVADARDLTRNPDHLRQQDKQLVLHVEARPATEEDPPSALIMSARAERLGLRDWRGPETRPLKIGLKWDGNAVQLQRPVTPLALFLSELRRDEQLPLPPRSDRD